MTDRKTTPDILGSLLGGSEEEKIQKPAEKPAGQDTIKPEYHNTGIPEYHKDSLPVSQPTIKTVKQHKKPASPQAKVQEAPGDKVKATFYMTSEVIDALEDGWIRLRKLSPKEDRGQISKSLIVEMALQTALEDLKSKGSASLLAKISKRPAFKTTYGAN